MDPLSLFDLPVPNIGRIAADALVHAWDMLAVALKRFFTPHQLAMFFTSSARSGPTSCAGCA
jgi:hypothetical protein